MIIGFYFFSNFAALFLSSGLFFIALSSFKVINNFKSFVCCFNLQCVALSSNPLNILLNVLSLGTCCNKLTMIFCQVYFTYFIYCPSCMCHVITSLQQSYNALTYYSTCLIILMCLSPGAFPIILCSLCYANNSNLLVIHAFMQYKPHQFAL